MYILTVVIIAVVVAYLVFKGSKRRVISRMNALVDGAKLTAFIMLENDLGNSQTIDDFGFDRSTGDDDEKLTQIAAASVNYWFGEVPCEFHKDLDLRQIHAASMRWLRRNDDVRELVVQAMRVLSLLRIEKTGEASDLHTLHVLKAFGKEYPDSPDPQSFEVLIQREMQKLSPDQQKELRRFIGA